MTRRNLIAPVLLVVVLGALFIRLPLAIADHVFEPFVSGRENGTGLGLALVSKLVGDGGGWISVTSVPGRTAFRISLPLAALPPQIGET